jgi:hypothetical protein
MVGPMRVLYRFVPEQGKVIEGTWDLYVPSGFVP